MTSHCSHHPEEEQWQCWWQWSCLWSSDNCQAPVLNAWHVFSHLIITRTQHSGNRHLFFKGGSGDKRGYFPQDHTASKEVSWNLSPVLLDPRAHALHWSPVLPGWRSRSPDLVQGWWRIRWPVRRHIVCPLSSQYLRPLPYFLDHLVAVEWWCRFFKFVFSILTPLAIYFFRTGFLLPSVLENKFIIFQILSLSLLVSFPLVPTHQQN